MSLAQLAPLALVVAAMFAGAAIYVSVAEHPARMALGDEAALAQWKASYERGRLMQAGLALAGALLGLWVWWHSLNLLWLIGSLFLLANWPFTLLVVMPVNRRLEAILPGAAGPEARQLLERWGRLHVIRADLGGTAALVMLVALYWRL
jgi:hypothetical protein